MYNIKIPEIFDREKIFDALYASYKEDNEEKACEIVRSLSKWIFTGDFLQHNEDLLPEILQDLCNGLRCRDFSENYAGFQSARDISFQVIQHLENLMEKNKEITGLSTGWENLDKQTDGLHPADLIVVASRPSMGKTAFAMNMVEHVALVEKKRVAVFSAETTANQLLMRMFSSLGRLDCAKLKCGQLSEDETEKLVSAVNQLNGSSIYFCDNKYLSPSYIRSWVRRLQSKVGNVDLIVVDSLQRLEPLGSGKSRSDMMTEIVHSLKSIAEEFYVPVVVLSSLSSDVDIRRDHRPVLADLPGGDAIEEIADLILFIHRDEMYNKWESEQKGIAEIFIAKQRNGLTGTVTLGFQEQYLRFVNLAPAYYNDFFS